jgi:hypothetical protein
MTTAGAIRQCPSCDLRFVSRSELEDHIAVDHPQPTDEDIPEPAAAAAEPAPPTRALVVFESMFGNTRIVAEAVAAGLASGAKVDLVEVAEAPTDIDADVGLLVVGGPTHAFGLSRPDTRKQAAAQARERMVSRGQGLREWLAALDCGTARPLAAAFDTRIRHVPGSAARAALRRLRHRGLPVAAVPASFYVTGTEGPLVPGEQERAERWGERLATRARAVSS